MTLSDWWSILRGGSFEWYLSRLDALLADMHARWGVLWESLLLLRMAPVRPGRPGEHAACHLNGFQPLHLVPAAGSPCCFCCRCYRLVHLKLIQLHTLAADPAGTAAWRWWGTAPAAGSPACCWVTSGTKVGVHCGRVVGGLVAVCFELRPALLVCPGPL